MFENAPLNPPDAIFGLIEDFKADQNPDKINLTVGAYQDESGTTPVMKAVQEAESILLQRQGAKSYLPIDGSPTYCDAIARLILGDAIVEGTQVHSVTAQTPGGTGALRVAGETLTRVLGIRRLWISDPTWANHKNIFAGAGLETPAYDYLAPSGKDLAFDRMLESLGKADGGEAVLLHTVCHNPTGFDLSRDQWLALFDLLQKKNLIPVFDFAYQGFGESLDDDAFPIREYAKRGGEGLICNSFSKNFSLYGERVGGVTAISPSDSASRAMLSQFKRVIRMMYSNPPMHGGAIVQEVLSEPDLRSIWTEELEQMRLRIADLRRNFVDAMRDRLPGHDFEYINQQRGMFSYSGLTAEQVAVLRSEYSIYALGSGRINIAGINQQNLGRLCDAIANVMQVHVA